MYEPYLQSHANMHIFLHWQKKAVNDVTERVADNTGLNEMGVWVCQRRAADSDPN